MSTPYDGLPAKHYWRTGVADVHASEMKGIYSKKFVIEFTDKIATAGSCFAQHVASNMRKNGYNILDVESLPDWVVDDEAKKHGYRIYSARYGNIYTARQLLQLLRDCVDGTVRQEDVWEKNGRFYDALRPSVEPIGLESPEEVLAHRRHHLALVAKMFSEVDVFVFTLGLTEAWQRLDNGTVYPTCPGVIAGTYEPKVFGFVNFNVFEVYQDMVDVRDILMKFNPQMRFILTVSPVPLTATASSDHVLVATTRSKSVLRSVCAALADAFTDIDYFPSYEIITSPSARSFFYDANLRSVTQMGVQTVMRTFFAEHPPRSNEVAEVVKVEERRKRNGKEWRRRRQASADDVVCEEALLEAFSK